jgi:PAS domain S-box-containing protein/excisionase family DNA binding protein
MKDAKKKSAMTVRDVADYLQVDEKTVYRLVQKRELPGFKVAGTWRFRHDEIDSWIDASREGSAPRVRGAIRLRALIVEDDAFDRMTVRKAIRETDPHGAVDIVEVSTIEAARAALVDSVFDCVVIDRALPDGDGVSLLDDNDNALGGAAVVVLTGLEDEEIARAALRRGAQDYLIKGRVEGHTLLRSIRYAIERKRLEEQQRRHEGSFRGLIEHSPDAFCVAREGKAIYTNPAFGRLSGIAVDEGGEQEVSGLVHPEDLASLLTLLSGESAQAAVPLVELRLKSSIGGWVLVEAWARPVIFRDEASVLLCARDISHRKQLEAQVVVASRMAAVGTLAAAVSHEINNPLAFVVANLDFAMADLAELNEEIARPGQRSLRTDAGRTFESILKAADAALSEARQGAARINGIVRGMKSLVRPSHDGDAAVPLTRAVDSTIDVVRNEIRHRAQLLRDFRAFPWVGGGEARIGQVVMNLLVNAAHAIPEGHAERNQIRLVIDETDDRSMAVLEVHDTGCGIAPSDLERIFDPLFTTKPVGSGTGLGLAICRGIVSSLGGSITVASAVGKGTTFRVLLPVISGPEQRVPLASLPLPADSLQRRGRILIVDDEAKLASALARTLSREHDVVVATDGRQALAYLESGTHYDVVICDLMMPNMTGIELHELVRTRMGGMADRMIFMTGGAFTPPAQAFMQTMAGSCLEKPFDMHTLKALVRKRMAAQDRD